MILNARKVNNFMLYHNICGIYLVSSLISRSHKREDIELCTAPTAQHWLYSTIQRAPSHTLLFIVCIVNIPAGQIVERKLWLMFKISRNFFFHTFDRNARHFHRNLVLGLTYNIVCAEAKSAGKHQTNVVTWMSDISPVTLLKKIKRETNKQRVSVL